jgi:hypothetical protein
MNMASLPLPDEGSTHTFANNWRTPGHEPLSRARISVTQATAANEGTGHLLGDGSIGASGRSYPRRRVTQL